MKKLTRLGGVILEDSTFLCDVPTLDNSEGSELLEVVTRLHDAEFDLTSLEFKIAGCVVLRMPEEPTNIDTFLEAVNDVEDVIPTPDRYWYRTFNVWVTDTGDLVCRAPEVRDFVEDEESSWVYTEDTEVVFTPKGHAVCMCYTEEDALAVCEALNYNHYLETK